jgi:hypothetical protein
MLPYLKRRHFTQIALAALLFALLAASRPAIANAQPGDLPAAVQPAFTDTTDPLMQQRELAAYVQANNLSARIMQLNLVTIHKISQYNDIDTSAYGYNACGFVAAAAALGGNTWPKLVDEIAYAAGGSYSPDAGIQPSKYVGALQQVFGVQHVAAMENGALGDLYRSLAAGKVVIVDLQVNAITETPATDDPNYAHFARVLGIDVAKHQVYIQNTLSGDAFWTLSLTDFVRVWDQPETAVSIIPDPQHAEAVTRWMVTLDNQPVTL